MDATGSVEREIDIMKTGYKMRSFHLLYLVLLFGLLEFEHHRRGDSRENYPPEDYFRVWSRIEL